MTSPTEVIQAAYEKQSVAPAAKPAPLRRLSDAFSSGVRMMLAGKDPNPLQTGFVELDAGLSKLGRKEVTMLAADSGIGKSTVSAQIALHAAASGHGVIYLNLEMPEESFGLRTIANHAKFSVRKARKGEMYGQDFSQMTNSANDLGPAAKRVVLGNQKDHRDMPAIRALCTRAAEALDHEGTPLALVIVDHVLQVRTMVKNDSNKEGEARADFLKELADSFDVHVIALVHITREGSKTGKMPTKNDLASSAWFDRAADNIIIFHQARTPDGTFTGGPAKLACQKARWGEPFAVELEYQSGFFYPWSLGGRTTEAAVTTYDPMRAISGDNE